jgi:hypothetical protein
MPIQPFMVCAFRGPVLRKCQLVLDVPHLPPKNRKGTSCLVDEMPFAALSP